MPLVNSSLGAGTHTYRHSWTEAIIRNYAGLLPVHAWFKPRALCPVLVVLITGRPSHKNLHVVKLSRALSDKFF